MTAKAISSVERWCERVLKDFADNDALINTLKGQHESLSSSFIAYTCSVAFHMFCSQTTAVILAQAPPEIKSSVWATADESLGKVMMACPLQMKDGKLQFLGKSMREFFAAFAFVRTPIDTQALTQHPLSKRHITLDETVQRLAGSLVDASLAQNSGGDIEQKTGMSFEQAAWGIIEASKTQAELSVAAANCATILNMAGVSFAGRNFARVPFGSADHKEETHPLCDLGGALLHKTDLSGAVLGGVRLQQAFLEDANMSGANLLRSIWNDRPALVGHSDQVHAVKVSPDGQYVYTGGADSVIRCWSLDTGAEIGQLKGHTKAVYTFAFSQDSLFSGGEDSTIRQWSCKLKGSEMSWKMVKRFDMPAEVKRLAVSSNGQRAYAGFWISCNIGVREFETSTAPKPKRIRDIKPHGKLQGDILAMALSHDDSLLYVADSNSKDEMFKITEWSVGHSADASQGPLRTIWSGRSRVASIALSDAGRSLFAALDAKQAIFHWSLAKGADALLVHELRGVGEVYCVAPAPDGSSVFAGLSGGDVVQYGLPSAADSKSAMAEATAAPKMLRRTRMHIDDISALEVSPDGRWVVSASWDKTARVWSVSAPTALLNRAMQDDVTADTQGHTHPIKRVALSLDGSTVYSADDGVLGDECVVCEWSAADLTLLRHQVTEGERGYAEVLPKGVNWTPRGMPFVVCGGDIIQADGYNLVRRVFVNPSAQPAELDEALSALSAAQQDGDGPSAASTGETLVMRRSFPWRLNTAGANISDVKCEPFALLLLQQRMAEMYDEEEEEDDQDGQEQPTTFLEEIDEEEADDEN